MTDVWATLAARLDYAAFIPTPNASIERSDLRRGDGTPYAVLKNRDGDGGAGTYLQLEASDIELFELMDGARSVRAIVVAHLVRRGSLALERLARLVAAMRDGGFFGEPPVRLYEHLRSRRTLGPADRVAALLRRLLQWEVVSWRNADRPVDLLYRAGARWAFTRPAVVALVAFGLVGLGLWLLEFTSQRFQLVNFGGSAVLGVLVLLAIQVLSIPLHEAGHALAVRHFGRRVRRVGLLLYYLMPTAYIDATDIALAPRRRRVAVSLAGPFADLVIVAGCAYLAWFFPESAAGSIGFKAATLLMVDLVLNMLPILELDGYHVVVEALEAPFLRQRAIAFVRGAAFAKLRGRGRWSRSEVGLATFGLLAILSTALIIAFGIQLWVGRLAAPVRELLESGPLGAVVLGVGAVALFGPTLLRLPGVAGGLARAVTRVPGRLRRRARIGERVAALRRVGFLAGAGDDELAAIASHLGEESAHAGALVVTIGEPGDRFYIVRSGRLEAIGAAGEHLNSIGPGEGFGELALLDRTTRSATVRAVVPTDLWSLDRAHFHRWVAGRFEVAARIRASAEERATLVRLPLFAGLAGAELDRVAARLRVSRVAAGRAVFRAGEAADRYYVIREGTAAVVTPDGATVRELGVGDGFGEFGLLLGVPRTATVTARTDLVLASLGAEDFAALVRAAGDRIDELHAQASQHVAGHQPRRG